MRGAGLSIEILTEYVNLFQEGSSTVKARKELLIEQRNQLADRIREMQETLDRLDRKIDGYEEIFLTKEEDLKR
jgi:DNA-binding transcriptional MerR regulator